MQSGMDYHGSAPDQIQQFVVAGRGVVHIPSLMFGTLSNPHGNFPSQAKQVIQQQGFQAFDPVENPNSSNANIKQKVHVAQEGCTDEDVSVVGDPGDKNSEANRWPREETLALLRIRAEMDANLKDSTVKGPVWETVSRKLAELGFYRSAKKCKEKFENVNKYYKKTKDGRINRQDGKAYRFCSELDALHAAISTKNSGIDNPINGIASNENIIYNKNNPGNSTSIQIEEITRQAPKTTLQSSSETGYNSRQNMSSDGTSVEELGEPNSDEPVNMKKRKRKQKMGTMKAFLENMVQQVLEHQETLQQKLLETIEKRDDDRLRREESWKRQEMARLNRQTEQRAQEHAIQSSREKAIISFLNKVTGENFKLDPQVMEKSTAPTVQEDGKCADVRESSDPRCKRWPKSEVYALIQLRSEMEQRFKESGPKVTLWEEISSSMAIMGFNRSAKRCKEKWENINKYFRKTKGSFKKRPLNTKTCPYFHQLDTLYRKGLLLSPGHAKFENNLQNHNSNSGALTNKDDRQGKSNEVQINNQDSELAAIIPSPNQVPTTSTVSESLELLAQKKMKWNNNFIDTMENQAAALKSRSVDEFSLIKNSHSRRFKMDGLDKDNSRRLQAQQHIFFNGFDRREQEGGLIDLEGNHQQQKIQINQILQPTEEQQHSHVNVSQSALMALVHKLSTSYPICPTTE